MKRVKFTLLAASILLAMVFTLTGCGDSSKFVGKWQTEKITSNFPDNMEILKDGTGIVDGMSAKWKVENERFYITNELLGVAYDYKFSGSTLTLKNDKSVEVTYTKQK